MSRGYIYILRNPDHREDLLKIGMTTRKPDERARDISRGTGVASEYEVLWSGRTSDCVLAERIVHRMLAEHRTNPNREFFEVPLADAIISAEQAIAQAGKPAVIRRIPKRCPPDLPVGANLCKEFDTPLFFQGFFFQRVIRPFLRLPLEALICMAFAFWWFLQAMARVCVDGLKLVVKGFGYAVIITISIIGILFSAVFTVVGAFVSGLLSGFGSGRK